MRLAFQESNDECIAIQHDTYRIGNRFSMITDLFTENQKSESEENPVRILMTLAYLDASESLLRIGNTMEYVICERSLAVESAQILRIAAKAFGPKVFY